MLLLVQGALSVVFVLQHASQVVVQKYPRSLHLTSYPVVASCPLARRTLTTEDLISPLRAAHLAAELLGADHPLVAQLVSHEGTREVVAPAKSPPSAWLAGVPVQRPVVVITDQDPCC